MLVLMLGKGSRLRDGCFDWKKTFFFFAIIHRLSACRFLRLLTIFSSFSPSQGQERVEDLPLMGNEEAEPAGFKQQNAFEMEKNL